MSNGITDKLPKRIINQKIDKALEEVMAMILISRETKQPLSDIALAVSLSTIDITNNKIKNLK